MPGPEQSESFSRRQAPEVKLAGKNQQGGGGLRASAWNIAARETRVEIGALSEKRAG